ncbi:small GTPase Cdc42 [Favolaschia claudopus]|uniref:Small GTPase Cdc42 n=1 Tax=Favolaschia claudopus TaxID=2862362 RepID=A0AAW0CLU1_9AGAR
MPSNPDKYTKKVVVLGDWGVGKTSMLMTFVTNAWPQYPPVVFDGYSTIMTVQEETYTLALVDTCAGDDYDRLRPLNYPKTDVFLLCFRINSLDSMLHIRDKWVPEIRHFCPNVPFLIVGTQTDLRDQPSVTGKVSITSLEEGKKFAYELGAAKYVECSAFKLEGLVDVFHDAIVVSLESTVIDQPVPFGQRKSRCIVV